MPRFLFLFVTVCFCFNAYSQAGFSSLKSEVNFTPNNGQMLDDAGRPAPFILAKASVPGMDLYLTTTGLTYVFLNYEEDHEATPHPVYFSEKKYKVHYSRVDVSLPGAQLSRAQMQFTNAAAYKSSYYNGSNRVEAVEHFKGVTVSNVYPGIDWVWKVNDKSQLEYDFVVHPQADASVIKMQYKFAKPVADGNYLKVITRNGGLTEGELKGYNAGSNVPLTYAVSAEGIVSFNVPAYDKAQQFVIDPPLVLNWSVQYGGTFADGLRGVATNASGEVFLAGYTTSTNFPVWNGGPGTYLDGTYNGINDAVVIKMSPAPGPVLLWATYIGGAGDDLANSIAVDRQQNIYVTGMAQSGFPIISGSGNYNQATATGSDVFICRFSPSLALNWSTFYGGSGTDEALKVYVDDWNKIWFTGYTTSATGTFPVMSDTTSYVTSNVAGVEAFVMRFDSLTNRQWATTFGANGNEYATSIVTDSFGFTHVVGFTSATLPLGNNYVNGSNWMSYYTAGIDGFIWQPATNQIAYLGYYGDDYLMDVTVAKGTNLYVAGRTNSTSIGFPSGITFSYYQNANAGGYDAFVAFLKVDAGSGITPKWGTFYGGALDDAANAITCDDAGHVYVTGFTLSTDFPVASSVQGGGFYQDTLGGNADGFIAGFYITGERFWSSYKGGPCYEYPLDVAYDNGLNKLYISGEGLFACNQSVPDSDDVGGPAGPGTDGMFWSFDGEDDCMEAEVVIVPPCPDLCNGSGTLSISGGTAPYQIVWSNGGTGMYTTLCGDIGEINVEVTDANGCVFRYGEYIPILSGGLPAVTNVDCFWDGEAWTVPEGGTPPYIQSWWSNTVDGNLYEEGDFGEWVTTSAAGQFFHGVLDAAGCAVTTEVYIDYNNYPASAQIEVLVPPTCGENNGILAISPPQNGPWSNYQWIINGEVQPYFYNDTLFNVGPGTYQLDSFHYACYNGEFLVEPTVLDSTYALNVQLTVVNPSCNVEGSATATVTGGSGTYYYWWNYGETWIADTTAIGGITIGDTTLFLSVYDDDNCYTDLDTMLYWNNYTSDTSIVVLQQADCFNEGVLLAVNGQGQPVNVNWQWNSSNLVADTLTAAEAATYYVPVSNCRQGEFYSDSAIVNIIPGPKANYTTGTILCNGGTATVNVTATGGTPTYTGTGSFTAPAGNYSYIVTDANGCADTADVVLVEPADLEGDFGAGTITCYGQTTTVNVTASGGTPVYTGTGSFNAPAGNHSYIVTDANGCTDTVDVVLSQPLELEADFSVGSIDCNGGSTTISVTALGGTPTYTGTGNFTAPAGSYSYIVTDANGCADTANVLLVEPTELEAAYAAAPIACNGGTTIISVVAGGGTPGYTGEGNFTRPAGNYSFIVTDARGCNDTVAVAIAEPTVLDADYTAAPIVCFGQTAQVTVTASGGVNPYTGVGNNNLAAGTHTLYVTDGNGCKDSVTVTLTEPTAVNATYTATPVLCYGGSSTVNITATGGTLPYTGTGSQTYTAGSYNTTVTDNNGCTAGLQITIAQPTQLEAAYTVTPIACHGGNASIQVTATGGTPAYSGTGIYTFPANNYTFVVTDGNGCKDTLAVTVTQPTAISTTVTAPTTFNCDAPISVTVSSTGGTPPYTGTGTVSVTPNTTANIIVTDNAGCKDTTTYNLTLPQGLSTTITGADTICKGQNVVFTASGNFDFTWQGNVTADTLALNNVQNTTTVIVQGISPEGCVVNDTVTLVAELCIGINEIANAAWYVYPNPATNQFVIEWNGMNNLQAYRLYANDGKLVSETKLDAMQQSTVVDCTGFAAGVYVLQLQTNGNTFYKKLVIEK